MRDAEAVELPRNAFELDLEHPLPQPAGLEPTPQRARRQTLPTTKGEPGSQTHGHRSAVSLPSDTVSLGSRNGAARSDGELLDDGGDGDDVALELEVGAVEPGGDADQLREVEDRHLEVLARLLAELELPGVEREMAQAGTA